MNDRAVMAMLASTLRDEARLWKDSGPDDPFHIGIGRAFATLADRLSSLPAPSPHAPGCSLAGTEWREKTKIAKCREERRGWYVLYDPDGNAWGYYLMRNGKWERSVRDDTTGLHESESAARAALLAAPCPECGGKAERPFIDPNPSSAHNETPADRVAEDEYSREQYDAAQRLHSVLAHCRGTDEHVGVIARVFAARDKAFRPAPSAAAAMTAEQIAEYRLVPTGSDTAINLVGPHLDTVVFVGLHCKDHAGEWMARLNRIRLAHVADLAAQRARAEALDIETDRLGLELERLRNGAFADHLSPSPAAENAVSANDTSAKPYRSPPVAADKPALPFDAEMRRTQ